MTAGAREAQARRILHAPTSSMNSTSGTATSTSVDSQRRFFSRRFFHSTVRSCEMARICARA